MTTVDTRELVVSLRALCRDVRERELLGRHVMFRLGGAADILVWPRSEQELSAVVGHLFREQRPFIVLGAGSNVLIADSGIRGVVLKIGKGLDAVRTDGMRVIAQAGVGLPHLARAAARAGLSGLEFAAGIPASVGGAVVMNAGAHGHAMSDVVQSVRALTPQGERTFAAEELGYAYRTSVLQTQPLVVLEATLQLVRGDAQHIRAQTAAWLRQRGETQPIGPPSSGCVFRNPPGDHAGRLIDLSGGKRLQVGGAQVSELHANYILNTGTATAADVIQLMDKVSALVMEKFGVTLEPEIKFLGEFPDRRS